MAAGRTFTLNLKTGAVTNGKVTGGTGAFKGATGTIKAAYGFCADLGFLDRCLSVSCVVREAGVAVPWDRPHSPA